MRSGSGGAGTRATGTIPIAACPCASSEASGRFLEVYDIEAGTGFEVGRVTAWETGQRVAFTWTQVGPEGASTDVEITFEAVDEGTLVRLEQTGFEHAGAEVAGFRAGYESGWREVLGWFADHATARAH